MSIEEHTNTAKRRIPPGTIKPTPMMRQYLQVKNDYPDCILFFRLGDFYEMFFEDAELASAILDIALTSRAKGKDAYPMCGVPAFAASGYINKLVSAGHKVAICDQVEDPAQAKGIVKREVTRVISPGMITEPEDLDDNRPNYLAAVWLQGDAAGLAYLDVSTAEFRMTDIDNQEQLLEEMARVAPREVLTLETAMSFVKARLLPLLEGTFCRQVEESLLERGDSAAIPDDLFAAHQPGPGWHAARLLYAYARSSLPGSLEHIRRLVPYQVTDYMIIDHNTRVNLELLSSIMEGDRRESLLGSIDRTATPMGARLLARWLLYPLVSLDAIHERHDALEQLLEDGVLRQDLRRVLGNIRDLERLLAKSTVGQPLPRDLGRLRDSLRPLQELINLLDSRQGSALGRLLGPADNLEDIFRLLDDALVDDPPLDLSLGGAIRSGYDEQLDQFTRLASDGRAVIAAMEERERQATSIGSLKIKFNRVFGYFIEVTKPNLDRVPEHYRRKQTTANAERFETEELKQTEQQILGAQENRVARERTIIEKLTEQLRAEAARVVATAGQVATCDVLAALAELAAHQGYCRPRVDDSGTIEIKQGRHPVVEQLLRDERFVPNDITIDMDNEQVLLITGPNMAGKSTVIRQVALICLLAQMGSFVPAASARIGLVDRLFSRVGASDNLARGLSTFMVEMTETAYILRQATRRSLLVLDEIGRGTSTFDGLSIAWSVAEYIHDRIGARTLFATHYHEITDLALTRERVANYAIQVKEYRDEIVFLRTLAPGACNRSYGIQVGKLAGLPAEVIERAKQVLANLEGKEYDEAGLPRLSRSPGGARDRGQMNLFAPVYVKSRVDKLLSELDPDQISPREALQWLYRLKKEVDE